MCNINKILQFSPLIANIKCLNNYITVHSLQYVARLPATNRESFLSQGYK